MTEQSYLPPEQTPRRSGYAMPAEWETQAGILLSAPLNPETWSDRRSSFELEYAAFAAAVTRFEPLYVLCVKDSQDEMRALFESAGADVEKIEFLDLPTNDAWCRDHGPVYLKNHAGERAIVNFHYNSWGGKFPPWTLDDAVPERVSEHTHLPLFQMPFTCEGGALEVNGAGTLLTTESVILNPNRNPGISKGQAEVLLKESLGVEQVLWLKSGLAGDDTDGHVDTLTRFFRRDAVLTILESDPASPNYAPLRRNYEDLKAMRLPDGSPLEVVALPCPRPIRPEHWREEILPASYANFLILNGAVLVPTYRQPDSDAEALRIIGAAFPGREIVPLDCYDILWEGGALHCLSQQIVLEKKENRK